MQFEIADFFEAFAERRRAGIEVFQRITEFINFPFDLHGLGEGGLGFFPERDALHVNALLRQVADAIPLRRGDFARGWLDDAGHAFHQS